MKTLFRRFKITVAAFTMLALASSLFAQEPPTEPDGLTKVVFQDKVENAYPHWSSDGGRILFQSNRTGKWQLYVMNRDGSNVQQITNDKYNNYMADWSPDNQLVAFVSDREGNEEIFVMRLDGSDIRNLSNSPARDIHPYFTPGGKQLLFNSSRDFQESFEVYRVSVDGSNLMRITRTADVETCAHLSPDGTKIVCLRAFQGVNDEICVMDADGKNAVNLTKSNAAEGWPSWSADGKQIIFSSNRTGAHCLYIVSSDGSGLRQLTRASFPFYDARAQISHDNSEIVFNRQREKSLGIYILPLRPDKQG